MSKWTAIAASAVVAIGLGATVVYVMNPFGPKNCDSASVAGGKAAIGGPFTLVNHKGETVTDKDIITGPTLIYFGYTFCPDVCPLDTARNAEAIDILDARDLDVLPVFITIDPARDSVSAISDFVEVIHPRMVGLTGTPEQIKVASRAYKTYFLKNGEGEDYLMDHSTFTYLMGPDGLWEFFKRDDTPEKIADAAACFIDQKS